MFYFICPISYNDLTPYTAGQASSSSLHFPLRSVNLYPFLWPVFKDSSIRIMFYSLNSIIQCKSNICYMVRTQ